jgi:hypothetical protein
MPFKNKKEKDENYTSKALFKLKTLKPCGMQPKGHHNNEQKLLNSFKNCNK